MELEDTMLWADSKKFDTGPISVSKKLKSSEIFKIVFSNLEIWIPHKILMKIEV